MHLDVAGGYDDEYAYTLPCESYLYIEGKLNIPTDVAAYASEINFTNNGLAFLLSEIRYEINGVEIQKLKSPGISSSLKGFCSHTPNELNNLQNTAWDVDMDASENKHFMLYNKFAGCIQLKQLLEFCEDYKKILFNCNQQIILNRSTTDLHCTFQEPLQMKVEINLKKNWDLCEYPVVPQNTSHSWTVKSSSLLEKPRFALIGFQTDRKNNLFNPSGRFDHCYLRNLKVYLNSEVYPYEDSRADFTNNVTAIL
ncbi:uncharacterized protein LOC111027985 [Myzus persicae]|uniref:uncharacterized protein LOC111027985 n=1 Tax=Myzus persicae TaxID=13164 RepID=UPI000B932EF3|nr:uncharacterized protein LOC111027985 [Myzus persicae]